MPKDREAGRRAEVSVSAHSCISIEKQKLTDVDDEESASSAHPAHNTEMPFVNDDDFDTMNLKAIHFLREMNADAFEDELEMIECCQFGCYSAVPIKDINETRESLMRNSCGRVFECVRHVDVLEKIVLSVDEMLKNTQKCDEYPMLFNDEIDLTINGRSVCKDAFIRIVRISAEELDQVYLAVKNPFNPPTFNSEHEWWSRYVFEHTYMNDEIRGFPCCTLRCYDNLSIREIVEARASIMDDGMRGFGDLYSKIVDLLFEMTVSMGEINNVLDFGYINYRINGKRLCSDGYCYTMGLDAGDNFDKVYDSLIGRLLIVEEANVFLNNMHTYANSPNL